MMNQSRHVKADHIFMMCKRFFYHLCRMKSPKIRNGQKNVLQELLQMPVWIRSIKLQLPPICPVRVWSQHRSFQVPVWIRSIKLQLPPIRPVRVWSQRRSFQVPVWIRSIKLQLPPIRPVRVWSQHRSFQVPVWIRRHSLRIRMLQIIR